LTGFMLGLPTGDYKFEIIAGAPAPEPKIRPDDETTRMMRDRIKARKARNAERVRRHRQRKMAFQTAQNVKVTALHSAF
jgi:hypothetical protein